MSHVVYLSVVVPLRVPSFCSVPSRFLRSALLTSLDTWVGRGRQDSNVTHYRDTPTLLTAVRASRSPPPCTTPEAQVQGPDLTFVGQTQLQVLDGEDKGLEGQEGVEIR